MIKTFPETILWRRFGDEKPTPDPLYEHNPDNRLLMKRGESVRVALFGTDEREDDKTGEWVERNVWWVSGWERFDTAEAPEDDDEWATFPKGRTNQGGGV